MSTKTFAPNALQAFAPNTTCNGCKKLPAMQKALQQAHLLLQTVAIRTAPQSLKELAQSCNMTFRNAAYLHPDVLKQFGLNATPGVSLQNVLGSQSLIVCTPLLPAFGVIYGPLYDLFLGDEQKSEEFEQHWNVAKLHRQRNTKELQG